MKNYKERVTTYQRLKAENKRLRKEIYIILFEPDSFEAIEIKFGYSLLNDIEKAIMAGNPITLEKLKQN